MTKAIFFIVISFLTQSDESRERTEKLIVSHDNASWEILDFGRFVTTSESTTSDFYPAVAYYGNRSGPLYNFIIKLCNVILQDFVESKIPRYIKILGKTLKGLGTGFLMKMMVRKFAKYLIRISIYKGRIIKQKVQRFLNIISEKKHYRVEFFKVVNPIYTVRQDIKMDSYIFFLKEYGSGYRVKYVKQITENIFRKVIFGAMKKQVDEVTYQKIQMQFKLAVIEYMEHPEII